MVERTSQKPIYLAMEDGKVASSVIQLARRYPNLETLRVAKPPGKLAVFMVEREPSVVIVDAQIAPLLISKAKSRVSTLNVIVVAPRSEILSVPIDIASRTRFLAADCSQREFHSLLDTFIVDDRVDRLPTPVSDMIALLSVGDHRGSLEIRNLETNESGTLSFSSGAIVNSEVGPLLGADALEYMKRWQACDFRWSHVLEGFDESFLEDVSLSLLAEASDLIADERGLVEATDTSMFPMSFDSTAELEEIEEEPAGGFFPNSLLGRRSPSLERPSSPSSSTLGARHTPRTTLPSDLEPHDDFEPKATPLSKNLDSHTETYYAQPAVSTEYNQHSHPGDVHHNISTPHTDDSHSTGSQSHTTSIGAHMASNASEILQELTGIAGFIAGAVVDSDSGMTLAKLSNSMAFDIDVAAATNTEVIKAKLRAAKALKLEDGIEDILITLTNQYHLLRPLDEYPSIFFYVALDREQANLAMARIKLKTVGAKIKL